MMKIPIRPAAEMTHTAIVIVLLTTITAGCNIFGEKDDNSNQFDADWKKASMPQYLTGSWQEMNYTFMRISTKKITIDNREWNIETIAKNADGEYRIVARSTVQYRAFYFRKIRETTAEKALGMLAFTLFDAKMAPRNEWTEMSRESK